MFFRSYRAFRYHGSIFCGNSVLSHFIIRLCSVVPMELNAKMMMEKKTGNLGCFVCPVTCLFFAQIPTIFGNITKKNKEHSIQNAPYIFFIKTCQLHSCLIF